MVTALNPTSLAAGFNDGGKGQTNKDVENAILNLRTRSTELAAEAAAIQAENTDGALWLGPERFAVVSGTWALAQDGNLPYLGRTADAGADVVIASLGLSKRGAASKGRKVTSYELHYSVNTADLDDVTAEAVVVIPGVDGAKPTAVVTCGDDDADYDEAHNTAAERGDDTGGPELHVATITDPNPIYSENDVSIRVTVDGDSGGSGVFRLYGVKVYFSETLVDAA